MRPLFRRKKYRIRLDGHRVFVSWSAPVEQWADAECREYLQALMAAVRQTVDEQTWALLSRESPCADPDCRAYVETVKALLMQEYGLHEQRDQVELGRYHGDVLVISFKAGPGTDWPYYYRGVQLKPLRTA